MCWPPWPNGQGVGLLIRRLRVRVPQGVFVFSISMAAAMAETFSGIAMLPAPKHDGLGSRRKNYDLCVVALLLLGIRFRNFWALRSLRLRSVRTHALFCLRRSTERLIIFSTAADYSKRLSPKCVDFSFFVLVGNTVPPQFQNW